MGRMDTGRSYTPLATTGVYQSKRACAGHDALVVGSGDVQATLAARSGCPITPADHRNP
jgi:hypothetical protein